MQSYYSIKLNDFQMQLYNTMSTALSTKEDNELYLVEPYAFLSTHELVLKAKNDPTALTYLIRRNYPKLSTYCRRFTKNNKYLNFGDVFLLSIQVIIKTVNYYQPEKGQFSHLLSRNIVRAFTFEKLKTIQYIDRKSKKTDPSTFPDYTQIKYLGFHSNNLEKRTLLELDIEKFTSYLPKPNDIIFKMYLEGFQLIEISKKLHLSYSNIFHKVKETMLKFKKYLDGRLII